MPTYKQVIDKARGASGLLLDAVVKDHILGYLLAGIAVTPGLGDQLAFKGGTALRKCWFPTYRYSEDLDFRGRSGSVAGRAQPDGNVHAMAPNRQRGWPQPPPPVGHLAPPRLRCGRAR